MIPATAAKELSEKSVNPLRVQEALAKMEQEVIRMANKGYKFAELFPSQFDLKLSDVEENAVRSELKNLGYTNYSSTGRWHYSWE